MLVGVLQGVGHGGDQLRRLAEAQPPLPINRSASVTPCDEIADQIRRRRRPARPRGPATMDGCRSWAALRASRRKRSSSCGRGQVAGPRHLDRDDTVQFRIAGLVDRAERAAADDFDQLELAELLSGAAFQAGRGTSIPGGSWSRRRGR